MTDLFLKVTIHLEQQLPFVVYAKPNADRMIGVFQGNDHLYFIEDFNEKGFVFAPFDGNAIPYIPQSESEIYVEKIVESDYRLSSNSIDTVDDVAKINFENLVANGVTAISDGTFKKVVLSRKESINLTSLDVETIISKMLSLYPTAFNYCFFHPKIGMWLGASPEQFLQLNQQKLHTVALAGTQKIGDAPSAHWQPKEIEEQQLVTEFITQSLEGKVSELTVSKPYSIKAGALWHIKTDITATILANDSLGDLIDVLHPTSAVCGLPKDAAKAFILQNEPYDREYYSGFLGELNIDLATFRTEQSDLFVNLRCMKIEGQKAYLYIGCGITKDSNPEAEFIETRNKAMTMKKVL